MSALADKVYNVVLEERGTELLKAVSKYPKHPDDELLTSFEMDCRDWGLVFGVAYAIARSEDAFESENSVINRALDVARDAWLRWAGSSLIDGTAFEKDRAQRPMTVETVA